MYFTYALVSSLHKDFDNKELLCFICTIIDDKYILY